jgi:prephenate dehydrogenase
LNKIGASIGLALKEHSQKIMRVCHDRDSSKHKKAIEMSAFDQAPANIVSAIENADIVILAVPIDEIQETIEIIAPKLKPGAVVLDTSILKVGVMEWAGKLLPEDSYFISFHPTLNPNYFSEQSNDISYAHPDLFQKSYFLIANSPNTDGDAIKLAADLSKYLGSSPYFADPYEIDGIVAGTEILPRILPAAYIHSIANQPGWNDKQRIAGNTFFGMAETINGQQEREIFGLSSKINKDNTIRVINNLIYSLMDYRDFLESENWEKVQEYIQSAQKIHDDWKVNRNRANWDNLTDMSDVPSSGDFFLKLVGFGKKRKKL